MSATNRGAEREELDGYYTPLPCARAICERLLSDRIVSKGGVMLEPCVGKGAFATAISRVLKPEKLVGVDLRRYPELASVPLHEFVESDFLRYEPEEYVDAIITNPPFSEAEAHARHALKLIDPESGVLAFLLRLNFLEGKDRTEHFWAEHPPSYVYVLNRRPSFKKTKRPKIDKKTGQIVLSKKTGKPLMVTSGNDATAYGVFVWEMDPDVADRTTLRWLVW